MKNDPFWQSAHILLRYRRLIVVSLIGAGIGACSFGAGLGMTLPTLHLLLQKQETLGDLVQRYLAGPDHSAWSNGLASWLTSWLPTDPLIGFVLIMAVIVVLSVIGSAGTYVRELMAITVSMRASMEWRQRLFRRLVHAPLSYTMTHGGGDQVSRLLVDTKVMSRGYTTLMGRAVGDLLGCLAALALALWLNWQLTALALISMPVLIILLRKFGKTIRRATRRVLHEQGRMVSTVTETVGGLRVIKVHNAEGSERRRFGVINRSMFDQEMRARKVRALTSPAIKTLTHAAVTVVAILAASLVLRRGVSPEELMTVLAALVAAAASARPLASLNNQLHESSAAARRVMEAMATPMEPTGNESAPPLPRHGRDVVFEQVSYTYPGADRPAIEDVTLTARYGERIAVVGGNGSGKTTLLSLLPRLLVPDRGRVLVDGIDIATVRLRSLRRQLGVVTQEPVLFQGTIADNIAYGRRYERQEQIEAAARAAFAHEFIQTLPDGYDAALGERGTGLSGGQRQRLCIARALLRDPAIMILDEATSQVDSESESRIQRALRDLHGTRTTFVIAHRLSTVRDADRIVVMEGGRIVDQGRHDELLRRCSTYRLLTETQLQPESPDAAPPAPGRDLVEVPAGPGEPRR